MTTINSSDIVTVTEVEMKLLYVWRVKVLLYENADATEPVVEKVCVFVKINFIGLYINTCT